jgi:hypothetical protein
MAPLPSPTMCECLAVVDNVGDEVNDIGDDYDGNGATGYNADNDDDNALDDKVSDNGNGTMCDDVDHYGDGAAYDDIDDD